MAACEALCGKPPDKKPKPPAEPRPGGASGGATGSICKCYPVGNHSAEYTGSFIDEDGKRCVIIQDKWKQKCTGVSTESVPPGPGQEALDQYYEDLGWTKLPNTGAGSVWTNDPGLDPDAPEGPENDYNNTVDDCEEDPNCTVKEISSGTGGGCAGGGTAPCCKDSYYVGYGQSRCCPDATMDRIMCHFQSTGPATTYQPPPEEEEEEELPDDEYPADYVPDHTTRWSCNTIVMSPINIQRCEMDPMGAFVGFTACDNFCSNSAAERASRDNPEIPKAGSRIQNGEYTSNNYNMDTGGGNPYEAIKSGVEGSDSLLVPKGPGIRPRTSTKAGGKKGRRSLDHLDWKTKDSFVKRSAETGYETLDVNNPWLEWIAMRKRPTGIVDTAVAMTRIQPDVTRSYKNSSMDTKLFKSRVPKAVSRLFNLNNTYKNWDSNLGESLTDDVLLRILQPRVVNLFKSLRTLGGTPFPLSSSLNMIRSRALEGTLGKYSLVALKKLVKNNKRNNALHIIPGQNRAVNRTIGFGIIQESMRPLDPNKLEEGRLKQLSYLWRTLPTDLEVGLPVKIRGVRKKFYVTNGGLFEVGGRSFTMKDGDYIRILVKGSKKSLLLDSEKDHAFLMSGRTKDQALRLFGSESVTTLSVSSVSGTEFTPSLNRDGEDPRRDAYIFKLVTSAVITTRTEHENVFQSEATYSLFDTPTVDGRRELSQWIKYKANHKTFYMYYDDPIFDYVEATNQITLKQNDILVDAAKNDKNIPILTRQLPYTIILFPTNRQDYMFSPTRSTLSKFDDEGNTVRDLTFYPSLNISKDEPNSDPYVTYAMDPNGENIYKEKDGQARVVDINLVTNTAFQEGYSTSGKEGLGATQPGRVSTSFRLAHNIVSELVANYKLFENRTGFPEINTFDLLSRMTITEFNRLIYLENSHYLFPRIRSGIFKNVKVIAPTKNDGITFAKKTRINSRLTASTGEELNYFPIKSSSTGQYIIPPVSTAAWSSKFGNIKEADAVAGVDLNDAKRKRNA